MALYNIANKELHALEKTTFTLEGLQERYDLQEAIKKNIDIIAPDCLVISEEFSDWEDSRRRIDLLAIDKQANLVVIELKRDETGAHMELQALRYAAMISTMSFAKACEYFQTYLKKQKVIVMGDWARCHEKRQFVRGMIALCTTHKRFWRESCFSHFYE